MISAVDLVKRYPGGRQALQGVSFGIDAGELVLVTGHTGAGKSTLMKLMSAIERPTAGSLVVNGQNVSALRGSALPILRRSFGLIFQDQKLLFDRSALDNVLLPLQIVGFSPRESTRRAMAALDKAGLLDRAQAFPVELSGGEQQRLAIARAVVNRPSIIFADEPTGNLDAESAGEVLDILNEFHRVGVTVVVSTHDRDWIQAHQPRVLHLEQGVLVS